MNQFHYHYSDGQATRTALLLVTGKQGWKEQLRRDVETIRTELQQRGGITANAVADAVSRYREWAETDRACFT